MVRLLALILVLSLTLPAQHLPVAASLEPSDETTARILDRFLTASKEHQDSLRGMRMEIDVDAQLPKLKKHGKLHALRKISKLGMITYKVLGFAGDNTVKKEVIARYFEAEQQAQNMPHMEVSPQNYKFKYKGVQSHNGMRVHVFQVTPRQKQVGLFRGELWLDEQTSLLVRESGRFVKNPSVFLKKVEFVRDYEIRDGVSVPKHIQSVVDTRLVGPAEININFTNVKKDEDEEVSALENAGGH